MMTESDTESVRQTATKKRLVLHFEKGEESGREAPVDPNEPKDFVFVQQSRAMTLGFQSLNEVNMEDIFEVRALVMKTISKFMRAVFKGAIKVSLQAIVRGRETNNICGRDPRLEVVAVVATIASLSATTGRFDSPRSIERESGEVQFCRVDFLFGDVIGVFHARGEGKLSASERSHRQCLSQGSACVGIGKNGKVVEGSTGVKR